MSEQVRVGIVGTSWYSDVVHLASLQSHPQAEITAICGRNRNRAEELARKYNIDNIFTDYRAMIEQGQLDAIIIAAPDDLHYAMTMDSLEAGLHVLCEKLMSLSVKQTREMVEKADEAGVKHMVPFTWRWHPHFRYLRQLIDEGYVGRCFYCHFRYVGGYGRKAQYGWRFDRQRSMEILGDLGSHLVDLARWYIGDITKASAQLSTFVDRPGVDGQPLDAANDSALLNLQFENGTQGMIHVSAVVHVADRRQEQQIVLQGEDGTLEEEFSDDVRPQDYQVLEVCIYARQHVNAIQMIHETYDGQRHPFPLRGRASGDCYILKLAADEFITSISGRFGAQVDSIRIQTNKQTSPLLGGEGSGAYRYEAPPGAEIVGFCGRAGDGLDAIGVIMRRRGL